MASVKAHFPVRAPDAAPSAGAKGKAAASAAAPAQPGGLSDAQIESALKAFDLDSRFGPCTGMTRVQRYERAEKNAASCGAPALPPHLKELLSPPVNADGRFTPCLWNGML